MKKIGTIPIKWKITGSIALALIAAAGVCCYLFFAGTDKKDGTDTPNQSEQAEESGGDTSYSAEGVTAVSTKGQETGFLLDGQTLTVEKVFAESGDEVSQGDALYQFTDESLAALKSYYEEETAAAEKAVDRAQLSYDTGLLEAEYTKESALSKADMAQEVYQASLTELQSQADSKQNAYNSAVNQINTYASNLANDTYYGECGVELAETEKKEAEKASQEAQTEWEKFQKSCDTLWNSVAKDITSLSKAMEETADGQERTTNTELASCVEKLNADYDSLAEEKKNLEEAEQKLTAAKTDFQQKQQASEKAQESYQQAVSEAQQKKEQLEGSLSQLEEEYQEAARQLALKQAGVQNDYDKAVLNGDYAQAAYDSSVNTLKETLEDAQKELAALQAEQAELNKLENGIFCAGCSGTLASVPYEAEDELADGENLVSYYDTDTISISVEVPQEQIAKIAVGDSVSVMISGSRKPGLTGTVSQTAAAATQGAGVSSVTYAVEVTLDNQDGTLSAGSSAEVIFTFEQEDGGN